VGIFKSNERYGHSHGWNEIALNSKAITVHSLEHACIALKAAYELNVPVTLLSAPGAAGYAGVGWFRALIDEAITEYPDVKMTPILDCSTAAGVALTAIREGMPTICFSGRKTVKDKIMDIAFQAGVSVLTRRAQSLDLGDFELVVTDLSEACRDWLKSSASS